MVNDRRMQRKNSFNSYAEARLAYGNRFSGATVFACDYNAFKCLQSLFSLRLLDAHMHAYGVARLKIRNTLAQLGFFNAIQSVHFRYSRENIRGPGFKPQLA